MYNKSEKVILIGAWPQEAKRGIESALSSTAVEVAERQGVKSMLPWSTIADMVSAVCAAITLGIVLWDRRPTGSAQPQETEVDSDLEELEDFVREQGIFDFKVQKIQVAYYEERAVVEVSLKNNRTQRLYSYSVSRTEATTEVRMSE